LTVGIQLVVATPAGFVGPKKMSIEPSLVLDGVFEAVL
jgi:hypothetical protein